jgi:hypothetical protein
MKSTCKFFYNKILYDKKSYSDRLETAIYLLDAINPNKFMIYFPFLLDEYLILALGCLGNRHQWSIDYIRDHDRIIKDEYRIMTPCYTFSVKHSKIYYLVNLLDDAEGIRCCCDNIRQLFNKLPCGKMYTNNRFNGYKRCICPRCQNCCNMPHIYKALTFYHKDDESK